MDKTIALVLGGGRGTRLQPLTSYRSKPAVPLAGKYRLIDIPLSNCINSGLRRVYVLTQFLSVSLHRHIRGTYQFDNFSGGFVELLAAQQTMDKGSDWYEGTADAVRKNLRYIKQPNVDHVVILSGDQLYRMDFRQMMRTHMEAGADVTIAAKPVNRSEASSLGVMRLSESGRVEGFLEKPQTEEDLALVRMDPAWLDARNIDSQGRDCLASMGIYLFNRNTLVDALEKTKYEDFGKEVFPALMRSRHVHAHPYDGYWEDIGTIRSFYESNLALAGPHPPFELANESAPLYSRPRFLPPTRADGATIRRSLIADGCHIGEGANIEGSVIGLRCTIGQGVTIRNSILMGADFYPTPEKAGVVAPHGLPPIGIGDGATIEGAIIDKNCRIGRNANISNAAGIQHAEMEAVCPSCVIRDGIIVMEKDGSVPDDWRLD